MTGKELIAWIKENGAEDHVVIVQSKDFSYEKDLQLWEGEMDGGAIMITVK